MPSPIMSLVYLWSASARLYVLEEAWLWRVVCREGGFICFQS